MRFRLALRRATRYTECCCVSVYPLEHSLDSMPDSCAVHAPLHSCIYFVMPTIVIPCVHLVRWPKRQRSGNHQQHHRIRSLPVRNHNRCMTGLAGVMSYLGVLIASGAIDRHDGDLIGGLVPPLLCLSAVVTRFVRRVFSFVFFKSSSIFFIEEDQRFRSRYKSYPVLAVRRDRWLEVAKGGR